MNAPDSTLQSVLCPECDGRGQYLDAPANVLDGRSYMTTCHVCGGTGTVQQPKDLADLTPEQRADVLRHLHEPPFGDRD